VSWWVSCGSWWEMGSDFASEFPIFKHHWFIRTHDPVIQFFSTSSCSMLNSRTYPLFLAGLSRCRSPSTIPSTTVVLTCRWARIASASSTSSRLLLHNAFCLTIKSCCWLRFLRQTFSILL